MKCQAVYHWIFNQSHGEERRYICEIQDDVAFLQYEEKTCGEVTIRSPVLFLFDGIQKNGISQHWKASPIIQKLPFISNFSDGTGKHLFDQGKIIQSKEWVLTHAMDPLPEIPCLYVKHYDLAFNGGNSIKILKAGKIPLFSSCIQQRPPSPLFVKLLLPHSSHVSLFFEIEGCKIPTIVKPVSQKKLDSYWSAVLFSLSPILLSVSPLNSTHHSSPQCPTHISHSQATIEKIGILINQTDFESTISLQDHFLVGHFSLFDKQLSCQMEDSLRLNSKPILSISLLTTSPDQLTLSWQACDEKFIQYYDIYLLQTSLVWVGRSFSNQFIFHSGSFSEYLLHLKNIFIRPVNLLGQSYSFCWSQ